MREQNGTHFKTDVVTLDVKMPDMGGLEALEQIMRENPVPVLMVSSLTSEGGEITLNEKAPKARFSFRRLFVSEPKLFGFMSKSRHRVKP